MGKLKAYIHIKAPAERVRSLAEPIQSHWCKEHHSIWVRHLSETFEATEEGGVTHVTVGVEYEGLVPFVETFVAERLQHDLTQGLAQLKEAAESGG